MINDPKAFTKNNNMKSPGYGRVMKWVIECWRELEKDLIIKSFEGCGITCSNEENLNSLFRYVLSNGHMPGTYIEKATGNEDIIGFDSEPESNQDDENSSVKEVDFLSGDSSDHECEEEVYELYHGPKTSKEPIRNKSDFSKFF